VPNFVFDQIESIVKRSPARVAAHAFVEGCDQPLHSAIQDHSRGPAKDASCGHPRTP
jgi:hypothetical protein